MKMKLLNMFGLQKKKKKLIEKNQRLVLMSVVCFGAK